MDNELNTQSALMTNNDVLKITARISTIWTFYRKQKTFRLVKREYKENLIGLALCYFKMSIYISTKSILSCFVYTPIWTPVSIKHPKINVFLLYRYLKANSRSLARPNLVQFKCRFRKRGYKPKMNPRARRVHRSVAHITS